LLARLCAPVAELVLHDPPGNDRRRVGASGPAWTLVRRERQIGMEGAAVFMADVGGCLVLCGARIRLSVLPGLHLLPPSDRRALRGTETRLVAAGRSRGRVDRTD